MNEGGRQQSSNLSERDSLINCDTDGKNSHELSFNLDQGVDVDLDLEGNIHTKNVLSFYKQKNYFIGKSKFFSIKPKQFFATSN